MEDSDIQIAKGTRRWDQDGTLMGRSEFVQVCERNGQMVTPTGTALTAGMVPGAQHIDDSSLKHHCASSSSNNNTFYEDADDAACEAWSDSGTGISAEGGPEVEHDLLDQFDYAGCWHNGTVDEGYEAHPDGTYQGQDNAEGASMDENASVLTTGSIDTGGLHTDMVLVTKGSMVVADSEYLEVRVGNSSISRKTRGDSDSEDVQRSYAVDHVMLIKSADGVAGTRAQKRMAQKKAARKKKQGQDGASMEGLLGSHSAIEGTTRTIPVSSGKILGHAGCLSGEMDTSADSGVGGQDQAGMFGGCSSHLSKYHLRNHLNSLARKRRWEAKILRDSAVESELPDV
jgi:hypothetical protein